MTIRLIFLGRSTHKDFIKNYFIFFYFYTSFYIILKFEFIFWDLNKENENNKIKPAARPSLAHRLVADGPHGLLGLGRLGLGLAR
jgi:hypothetical protein